MNIFGIALSGTDLWLLAIAGACLGWFIPHRLSVSRERQNSFRTASLKFRAAILSELSGLYPIPSNWPSDGVAIDGILRKKFPALQSATTEFSRSLPRLKRLRFDRAWRLYHLGRDGRDIDQQSYWQYVPHSGAGIENGKLFAHDNNSTYKANFKNNIDRLLEYSKET